jgi:ribose transport system substrate-binding protein
VSASRATFRARFENSQAGRLAADILADEIKRTYADAEGDVAIITSLSGVTSLDQRARGFKSVRAITSLVSLRD